MIMYFPSTIRDFLSMLREMFWPASPFEGEHNWPVPDLIKDARLAYLLLQRWKGDIPHAAAAWRRMTQTVVTSYEFAEMVKVYETRVSIAGAEHPETGECPYCEKVHDMSVACFEYFEYVRKGEQKPVGRKIELEECRHCGKTHDTCVVCPEHLNCDTEEEIDAQS